MYLLKIRAFIFLFISTTNAYNFKLCCPFAHQYNISNEACFPNQEPHTSILKIYNSTVEVNEISGKVLNVINYAWCRNEEDELREIEEITDPYYLQENGELYIPSIQEEYFKSNKFCLSTIDSTEENIPILCKFEETEPDSTTTVEYSTIKNISPASTTLDSIETTSSVSDCDCITEPPKIPEIFCENLFNGTFEYCAKCTIENTCEKQDCTTNISLIEFVDVLKETTNKRVLVVQVNKKKCPYWKYTYNLNRNNTVHLSILNQICDEPNNTKASFNARILLYIGVAFLIIVLLGFSGILVYFIKQKRMDAAQHAAFVREMNTQETEMHPMFRPNTEIYRVPDDLNFK